jgi:hypothetical protein
LSEAEHLRKMRRDLVHEKAVEFGDLTADAIHVAQHEAKKAVPFVKKVAERLGF